MELLIIKFRSFRIIYNFKMHVYLDLLFQFKKANRRNILLGINVSRGFLIYRTVSTTRQSCNCSMSFSCSCCQSVMILYTRKEKDRKFPKLIFKIKEFKNFELFYLMCVNYSVRQFHVSEERIERGCRVEFGHN